MKKEYREPELKVVNFLSCIATIDGDEGGDIEATSLGTGYGEMGTTEDEIIEETLTGN